MSWVLVPFPSVPILGRPGRRRWWLAVVLLASSAMPARVAGAGSVGADAGPDGVTVTIVQWEGRDRVQARGTGVDGGCDHTLAVGPPGFVPDLSTVGPRPADAHLAVLMCDGRAVALVWVGPHNTVDLADAARGAAQRWVETIPVPTPVIGASPTDAGLVGIESWFWIEGGPDGPIVDRVEAFGVGVDVRLLPSPVTWSFGDGRSATGGAGRPWPARSDIRHAYRHGGRMTVAAGLRLEPAYRVAGGTWLALPTIEVAATRAHAVQEAQAVITG